MKDLRESAGISYEAWCEAVVELVASHDRIRNDSGISRVELLEACRGDEPRDSYDSDETAGDYADFIMSVDEHEGNDGFLDPKAEL